MPGSSGLPGNWNRTIVTELQQLADQRRGVANIANLPEPLQSEPLTGSNKIRKIHLHILFIEVLSDLFFD